MATVTVNINATDNMSPVIASLQQQLNQLQQQANVLVGGRMGQAANQMANYTTRLFENMLNSMGTKLWKSFTNNLKSAYNEIKAIDDELVVVRRITGKTNEELTGMTENAMKVAQAYGIAASKYLSGVADFTRAGYQGQAEGLAELSVKLQRAGDVSADVANQYILAIDKAYGLQGNIEALTAAMDGANQIGNEYATNVGEIAAGIGKVATIASTAHVGINELTAALGTITAVTQRSGTEAATALRAIFLNIMGDTSTEIEEGAKWTAGEIEGLRQVLELYAPEVVRAAEATGTLIDPMEAIGALAKSYQDGILTEAKLFSMVSDIGGKLRTNQLMVLIKNWDMYESMLNTYANASGSIDREVANSLDSITVKTERLKASWVALVNETVSTGMIKGVLDGLNTAVQSIGNLGNALAIVLGLVTALKAQRVATLFAGVGANAGQIANLTASFRGFGLAITAIGVALSAANGIIKAHNDSIEKNVQAAIESGTKAGQSSQEIMKLYTSYITAKAGTEEYTTALHALAEALGMTAQEAINAGNSIDNLVLKKLQQAVADAKTAVQVYDKTKGDTWFPKTYTVSFREYSKELIDIVDKYKELFEMTDSNVAIFDTTTTLDQLITQYRAAEQMQEELRLFASQNGINLANFQPYLAVSKYLQEVNKQYQEAVTLMEAYSTAEANLLIKTSMPEYQSMADLMKQIAEGGEASETTLREYAQIWDELISSIQDSDFDGYGKWVKESLIGILDKQFPQIAKFSKQWAEIMNPGENKMADQVAEQAESVNKLAVALSNATKAKNAFDEAMKRDAENKGFKNYQDAYTAYAQEIEAGRVNSQLAMAAAEYLMAGGAVDFETLYREQGYKGVNAYMEKGFFKTLYGDADKAYGEGLLDILSKLADKNGEVKDSAGNVVATYKKVGKEVSFTIDDLKGLSEVMGGISPAQIWDSIKALGVYGDIQNQVESFTNALEAMGKAGGFLASSESGKLAIDYEKFLNYAKESSWTSEEWSSMKDWLYMLNELGEIEIQGVPDVEGGWQEYDDMVDGVAKKAERAAESAKEAKEDLEDAAETVQETKPAMPGGGDEGGGEGGGSDNKAQAIYDEYSRVLAEVDALIASKDYTITFNADGWPAIHTIETIETDAGEVTRERTIQFNANGDVVYTLDILKDKAGEVAETRTIYYNADGTIDKIDIVRANASDPSITDHFVYYYTNGEITSIELTKSKAGEPLGPHLVAYYTDGYIDHLELVDETAQGIEKHTFKVNYGTDGSITGLTETKKTAEGVEHREYQFQFGADGKLLETKVSSYMEYADGTTSVPFEYTLSANDGPAFDEVAEILAFIQGNYTDKSSAYTLDANNDPAENVMLQTVEEIAASTGGNYGQYTLDADNKSALAAIKEVEDKINQLLPDHRLEYSKGNTLTDALYNATLEALHSSDRLSEAQRSYFTSAQNTVEYYHDENGKPVEKSTQIDDKGNGTVTYTYYTDDDLQTVAQQEVYDVTDGVVVPGSVKFDKVTDEEIADQTGIEDVKVNGGTWVPDTASFEVEPDPIEAPGQEKPTIEVAMEVTPDKASAEEAANEAQKIASLTLGANPVPFIPEEGYDGEYAGQWDGNDIYTVSFEIENEGVFDDIMYIDKESGKPHVISIQTAGDGAQTITETVYTLDGAVESQNVIRIDAEGNAETNLQSLEALVEFLNRTFNISVQTNTGNSVGQLNRVKDLLDSIKSKTVTVTTKQVNIKDPKDPDKVATAATGAVNFNSGYALINEEGPELVAADGMASIYANGFPTIAKIPSGATIYTAEQTAKMLGGKMSLPAYADGTIDPAIAEFIASLPTGPIVGTITEPPPPKKEEEEEEEPKKEEEPRSSTPKEQAEDEEGEEFWDTIRKYIEYGLKKIMYQIEGYQDDIEAIEKARDKLLHPIEEELEDLTYTLTLLEYEVTLLERARDDAVKPLDKEIERLEKARDISKEEYDLEEKRQALEDARNQRTIRQFNEETGQWEWVADQKAIADAEKAYNDAMADYEISQLKRERDAIYDSYQDEIDALEEQEEVIKRRQEDLEIEKTKIEYEYNEMIEPLQEKVDELQDIYDDLEKYYNHLVDAVEVPTEDLTEALEQMRQAEERYANQVEETVKLLNTLYDLAPTWSPVRVEDTITQYRPGYDPIKGTTTTITNVYIDGVSIDGPEATTITHILKKHRMYHGG